MNKRIILLVLLQLIVCIKSNQIYAQYCNPATSNVAITPTAAPQNTAYYSSGIRAFNFVATAGCTYTFATCGNTPTDYDPILRLYSTGTGGSLVAIMDDNCGTLQEELVWTCSVSGTYSILLSEWSCLGLNQPTRITYFSTCVPAPTSITASATTVCSGMNVTLQAQGAVGNVYWFTGGCATTGQIAIGNTLNVSPSTTTTYYARNNLGGVWSNTCTSVTITVVSNPYVINAGPNVNVCAGSSINLAGSVTSGSPTSTTWTAPSGSFSAASSLTSQYTPTIGSGTVDLTLTTNDPAGVCPAETDQVTITVIPNPYVINAGANVNVCAGSSVTLAGSITSGSPTSTIWTAPSGTFSAASSLTSQYTPSIASGTVNLTLTTNDPAGVCPAETDQVTITVIPNPYVINAGANVNVCAGSSVTLAGTITSGSPTSTVWTAPSGSFSAASSLTSQYTPSIASGTVNLTLTTNDPAGVCPAETDQVTITVITNPYDINAGADIFLCAGSSVTLGGSVTSGSPTSTTWSSTFGTFSNTSSLTSQYTPDIGGGTVVLTLTTNDPAGVCPAATDQVSVFVSLNPNYVINAGANINVCASSSVTLAGSVTSGSPTSTIWTAPSGTLSAASSLTSQYTPSITSGTVTLTLSTDDPAGVCPAVTDQVTITVVPNPYVINAGANVNVCAGSSVTLAGTITSGSPTSTVWTAPSGTFSAASSLTSQYTPSIASGTVNLTLSTNNPAGVCPAETDQVTITVIPNSFVINAGANVNVCAGSSVTLAGSVTSGSPTSTIWTAPSGTFSATSSLTSLYTPSIGSGTVDLTLTTNDPAGVCPAETDQVTITVIPNPYVINAGSSFNICAGTTVTIIGVVSSGSPTSTVWSAPSSTFSDPSNLTTQFTPSITSGTINLTLTTNDPAGVCPAATDHITATIIPNPYVINAGANVNVCAGSTITLAGSVTSGSPTSTVWTAPSGTFSAASSLTSQYTPSNGSGTVTLTLTTNNPIGVCPAATDQVTITVIPNPSVIDAGTNVTVCAGQAVTLVGAGATTYTWDNAVIDGVSFVPTSTTTYTLSGTDANGCVNTDQVDVIVNPLPVVIAGADKTICAGESVTLVGAGATTYTWDNAMIDGVSFVPASTTTYTLSGTDANGCINTDQLIVTVNPLPIVIAGADKTICAGEYVTLVGAGATTYTWDNAVIDGISFIPTSTTTYTLSGTDANGCVNTDQVDVIVNPLPVVIAGTDQTVCAGQAVTLIGAGATTYTWDNAVIDGVSFVPTSTTTYTLSGTDANGCVNTDQVGVIVNPLPVVITGADKTICAGESVTLVGTGGTTYTWDNAVIDGVSFIPASTTTYTLSGTDANGCVNTDQVIITVNPLPIVIAGANKTICAGESVTLVGAGATTYTWDNAVIDGVSFIPTSTTTYTLSGTDANGCVNTDQVDVIVNPLPVVIAGTDQTVCAGESVTLVGAGATTYTWDNAVIDGVSFVPPSTTTYTLSGTDANGCTNTDQLIVTVNPLPNSNFSIPDYNQCAPSVITFENLNFDPNINYTWYFENGTIISNVSNPSVSYNIAGCFDVSLSAVDLNGCTNTTSFNNNICIDNVPIAQFTSTPMQVTSLNTQVQFTNTSIGSNSYVWSFDDNSPQSNLENPTHYFPENQGGNYNVELIGYSELGCVDTAYFLIKIEEELIYYVPNSFTPDASEINDVFLPIFSSGFDESDYNLSIYNRWGEIVFETDNYLMGWNGYDLLNNECQSGVYTWVIIFNGKGNIPKRKISGHVNFLR